jgi:peroxiredoxin Q/BCP
MARGVQVGDKAPDFTLPSQSGEEVRLHDRLGQHVVVLYFYPKDNTSGCTAEACAFRDSYESFTDAGAEVIGVSSDSASKHAGFADKHELSFTLLSDKGSQVRKSYGVPAALGLIPGRVTYVIDRDGTVRHVFNSMTNIGKHVGDALEVVKATAGPVTSRGDGTRPLRRKRQRNLDGGEDPAIAVVRAAAGLGVAEAGVDGQVLGHDLVCIQAEAGADQATTS